MTASEFFKMAAIPDQTHEQLRATKVSKLQSFIHVYMFDVRAPCVDTWATVDWWIS